MSAQNITEKPATPSRRDFLRVASLGIAVPVATAALAACKSEEAPKAPAAAAPAAGPHADSNHSGGTTAAHPRTPAQIRAAKGWRTG
jgi:hypothetical protein